MPDNFVKPQLDEAVIRSFNVMELRATEEEGVIEGHAAIYGQKVNIGGWFYEVIERGAFDNCDFSDVIFTANHEIWKIPLARSKQSNFNSTLQVKLDEKGLFIRATLDLENNADAKSLYSAVKRGDIDGMSFVFYIKEDHWIDLDTDIPTRFIKVIKKVREVSAVNYPAYEGTDISARSSDKLALDNARAAVERARSAADGGKNELELLKLKIQILAKG